MPVFIRLTRKLRPGKRFKPIKTPELIPRRRLMAVADKETPSERSEIRMTSGSPWISN
jgi:hypothetical protein